MVERIDYQIEKYSFAEVNETPRIAQQWAEVLKECRQVRAGSIERLRIALLNVDYVTSFELPFRLLLVRTPQLIAELRDELQLSQKSAVFNGKRFGCVYSVKSDLCKVPDEFQYRLSTRIRREVSSGETAEPYREIAREIKMPRERYSEKRGCVLRPQRFRHGTVSLLPSAPYRYTAASDALIVIVVIFS